MPVTVRTTKILQTHFETLGANLDEFASVFKEWKEAGQAGAEDVWEFGRDSAYVVPVVNGVQNVLKHVHLVPLADDSQWEKDWNHYSQRTSDRALVYAEDVNQYTRAAKYLLIAILEEPGAHKIAAMNTPEDRARMEKFAAIAEAFIFGGDIVA